MKDEEKTMTEIALDIVIKHVERGIDIDALLTAQDVLALLKGAKKLELSGRKEVAALSLL
jgi:hypothetical protein